MSDFNKVLAPQGPPGKCRFCGDFQGPMIDTYVDDPIYGGRIYICGPTLDRPGCLGTMARLFGWRPVEEVSELTEEIDRLVALVDQLEQGETVTISRRQFEALTAGRQGMWDGPLQVESEGVLRAG